MSLSKILTTAFLLLVGVSQAQAVIVVERHVPAVVTVSPYCSGQAEICRKTCIGPFCATECSDFLNECRVSPTIVWDTWRRHWHGHGHHYHGGHHHGHGHHGHHGHGHHGHHH